MRDRWLSLASPLVLILLWEALSTARILDPRLFSAPSAVGLALAALLAGFVSALRAARVDPLVTLRAE